MPDENRDAQPTNEQDSQNEGQELEQGSGEETTEGGSEPDYKTLYEKEREMRQGLVGKVKKLSETKGEEPKSQTPSSSNYSEERLDKLELRQIDKDLTAEQTEEILTIKKAKGLSDVSDAYNHPMIQSYLKSVRETENKQQATEKAIPKTQGGSTVAESQPRRVNQSRDWLKQLPGDATDEVAEALKDRFFPNN